MERSTQEKNNEIYLAMYKYWSNFGVVKRCMGCGKRLPKDFSTINVDHLLMKSVLRYSKLSTDSRFFFLVCSSCHKLKEDGYPVEKHKKAIKDAEIKFQEGV